MKNFICDICGQHVTQHKLTELLKSLRSEDVKEVCPSCLDKLQKYSEKLHSVFIRFKSIRVKKMITKMKSED